MKKFLFSALLLFLFTGFSFSQSIKKGNLLGIHVAILKPGVSTEQVENFFLNTYIPALEKELDNIKIIPMHGIRGEHIGSYGLIMVMKSEKDRAIYWNNDGTLTEKGKAMIARLQSVMDERDALVTSIYTDWLVK